MTSIWNRIFADSATGWHWFIAKGSQLGSWLIGLSAHTLGRGWTTFGGTFLLLLFFNILLVGEVLVEGTAVLVFGTILLTRFGLRQYTPPWYLDADELSIYGRPSHTP